LPANPPTVTNTPAPATVPGFKSGNLPQLIASRRPANTTPAPAKPASTRPPSLPNINTTPQPPAITPAPLTMHADSAGERKYAVTLAKIKSILPVGRLLGLGGDEVITVEDFTRILVEDAAGGGHVPALPGDLGRQADGTCICQFPTTISAQVIPLKLLVLREKWNVTIETPDPAQIILRKSPATGLFGRINKKCGMEVTIKLPPAGRAVGEVTVTGKLFGNPSQDFIDQATEAIPRLIADVRQELKNVDDRRKHPRVATNFPVTIYPIHSAGGVDLPLYSRCRDVSVGGLCIATEGTLNTKYAYAVFEGLPDIARYAILVRFLRSQTFGRESIHAGQFRVDL
jgi:hypothetical protein